MLILDIQEYVIRPALGIIQLGSKSAEILLAGTILCETGGDYLKQVHGPALGLYQIEPTTHIDVKKWLMQPKNKNLLTYTLSSCFAAILPPDDACLIYHLRYATIIARFIYYRAPASLPRIDDAQGFANYHKKFYNTPKGKADVTKNIAVFEKLIHEQR